MSQLFLPVLVLQALLSPEPRDMEANPAAARRGTCMLLPERLDDDGDGEHIT